ncbi:MAG: hypothetical protein IJU94_00580 [Clostridia bacterium]|nr:hypothetical protein [Clostridia bacterium]
MKTGVDLSISYARFLFLPLLFVGALLLLTARFRFCQRAFAFVGAVFRHG